MASRNSLYEDEHYPVEAVSPVEVLNELISANYLWQRDLTPLLGGESEGLPTNIHTRSPGAMVEVTA
jgi:antitoxin component HigA of HigAB toxin-antitoxin module